MANMVVQVGYSHLARTAGKTAATRRREKRAANRAARRATRQQVNNLLAGEDFRLPRPLGAWDGA